jgi:mercuric transport protein
MSIKTNTGETVTLQVSGMSCGGCSASVQRALQQHPGVSAAAVDLARKSATVEFDAASTSAEALVQAVRSAGYGAELSAERMEG